MVDTDDALTPRPELSAEEFAQRLDALREATVTDVTIFSDLDRAKLSVVRRAWPRLPLDTRRQLVALMNELGEENIEYNFSRVLKVALRDSDPALRTQAIAGLWEDDSEDILAYLIQEGVTDPDRIVREEATRAIGRFAQLLAEEELSPRWFTPLRAKLLELVRGEDSIEVRRRALEALSVYTDDPEVTTAIRRAYESDDEPLRESALYAMGRNLDERWLSTILEEMNNPEAGLRYEATRASGEFGDRRAVPQLIELLGDDDREVQLAAVAALGRIGGDASIRILKRLASTKDEIVREAAEEALDEASFMTNPIGVGNRLDRGRGGE
jgi:HEAT repeat protein